MRYIIYGAGGVGSVLGGFLHLAGKDVVLVARMAHVEAIKKGGLKLNSSRGRWELPVPAVETAKELAPFTKEDVLLLTAKSQHTHICLAELIYAGAPRDLPIFCMQNSIWNEAQATRVFHRVYGAMIIVPGFYMEPGEVIHYFAEDLGYIDLGVYPSGRDTMCEAVAKDLNEAGYKTRCHNRVMNSKGGKCLVNLQNALALFDTTEEERELFLAVMREEAMQVWNAAGIDYEGLAEFRKRTEKEASFKRWEAPELAGMDWGGSGWQTLARKAGTSETPYINGDVVVLGELVGIPAPANRAITKLHVEAVEAGAAPRSMPFRRLYTLFEKYRRGY
jgi:2-dehydropantoate 2-reductase